MGIAIVQTQAQVFVYHASYVAQQRLVLTDMQDSAQQRKQQLQVAVTDTEQQLDSLRKWVGEAGDADPAAMLHTIWTFANLFDQAYRNVQRLLL